MKNRKFKSLAKSFLNELGNPTPNSNQLSKMESMIATFTFLRKSEFDNKLSAREVHCLVLAAQGKTTSEIAELLKIKEPTVSTHRREILRKLNCKTMAHAVFQSMRYNILHTDPFILNTSA